MTASTRARSAAARWPWLLGLGALLALYAWHAVVWVPRAGYTVHSDPDAAGWSSALAARVRAGEPLYAHAAAAFAPGGVALMALVQRVTGRVTLADELTLVALLRPVLALAAGLVGAAVRGWGAGLVLGLGTLVVSVGFSPGGVELWVAAPLAWCSTAALLHAWAGDGPPTPASATPARRALVVAGEAIVEEERNGEELVLRVHEAAIFTNYLGLKKRLMAVEPGVTTVVIDFENAWVVDHTVLDKLHGIERSWTGRRLLLTGLDGHDSSSDHELALRRKARPAVTA